MMMLWQPSCALRAYAFLAALFVLGCDDRTNMLDQPKMKPMAESTFFADGTSARPLVPGTVPRSGPLHQFAKAGEVTTPRPRVTAQLLERGRERFNIFCSVCHGRDGYGEGVVVQRGFPAAAAYHTDRLRSVDDAHVFAVITDGYQNCPANGPVVPPADRWAIVAYVRALQLSQHARIEDVPEDERSRLKE